jgi:hypothetical protein
MLVLQKSKLKTISLLLTMSLMGSNLYLYPLSYAMADSNDLNFKVYNPTESNSTGTTSNAADTVNSSDTANTTSTAKSVPNPEHTASQGLTEEKPANDANQILDQADETTNVPLKPAPDKNQSADSKPAEVKTDEISKDESPASEEGKTKILQGYVRVVPTGTKISIIMDTAVDSDTSQEGDEFSARTAEDLTIDGTTAVPAGSVIRGRIATLNAPKHLNRSGSVALKFDSVTTPDNRQIPLVANLVARGGVVHARRGIKDIAIDTGTFALPTAVALGIGAVAGHSSSSVGVGGGALIGAAVGAAIGVCILMAKKGKRVDVRPGDELKIELAEDLHMPSM